MNESILHDLLAVNPRDNRKERDTKELEVLRLSKLLPAGQKAVFKLSGLTYGQVEEVRHISEDNNIHIILHGVVEPSLRDPALMAKYNAVTPVETVKALFTPGEIEDLAREIERLSGFRMRVVAEVKND